MTTPESLARLRTKPIVYREAIPAIWVVSLPVTTTVNPIGQVSA